MSSAIPSITVVIPAYNAAETIEVCMAALTRQTTSRERYEVILVDDVRTSGASLRAAAPHATGALMLPAARLCCSRMRTASRPAIGLSRW